MRVTVHVRPEANLNTESQQQTTPQASEIVQAACDLGVRLEPLHPGVRDPKLANSFAVEVPDAATAKQLVERLQNCEAIEAAYIKPANELP